MVALLERHPPRAGRHQRHRGGRQAAGAPLSAAAGDAEALLVHLLASTTPTGWKAGALDTVRGTIARTLADEAAVLGLVHQLSQLVALLAQRGEQESAAQLARTLETSLAARGASQGVLEVREEQREELARSQERASQAFRAFAPAAPAAAAPDGPVISAATLLRGSTKG